MFYVSALTRVVMAVVVVAVVVVVAIFAMCEFPLK